MKTAIERLIDAIGYPDGAPAGALSSVLRVDGAEVSAEVHDGMLVLSQALTDNGSLLPALASYAAGRMLKEDAVLAYGEGGAFLWQSAPADSDEHGLLRLFETFMDSGDWWRARMDALAGREEAPPPETVMIRP
ncbi:MAG: hypothetical protein IJI54_08385 [Kiritimatiellae bacterium]|nr:hypothetical protein [Kiritimatiellia bacterium]